MEKTGTDIIGGQPKATEDKDLTTNQNVDDATKLPLQLDQGTKTEEKHKELLLVIKPNIQRKDLSILTEDNDEVKEKSSGNSNTADQEQVKQSTNMDAIDKRYSNIENEKLREAYIAAELYAIKKLGEDGITVSDFPVPPPKPKAPSTDVPV